MWRTNNQPYKGTQPDDLGSDESSDSSGYADPLGDGVFALAWISIVALVAYLTWAYKAGMLPVWG
jgi:hypothetical protein